MATAQAASIQVVEVTKRYGHGPDAVLALDAVSLEIRGNEFFTLLGPSGCGKTTLLRMIAGFDEPTTGEIRLDDKTLSGLPPFRRPVNTVFQSYALFPHLNVRQNVAFGLEMQRRAAAEIGPEVDRALAMVRLRGFEDRWPRQLSGGQQQRVALARALANRPRVLLLDEPLSALDLKLRKEMQLELKRLQLETGITFVFVTHDQEEALTMSDRIAVMDHGQVLQIGPPTEIYDRPATKFVADFIGETDLLEAVAEGPDEGGMRFRLPGGGSLTAAESPSMAPGSKVTLAFRPERVDVLPPGRGGIPADVTATVYTGTDTMAHLTLAGGVPVRARLQNREGAADLLRPGEKIEISVAPAAVRVLAA